MKTILKFITAVLLAHIITYLIAGIFAQVVLGVKDFYPPSPNAISYLRDPLSGYVMSLIWPAQLLRGILFSLALLPFRKNILAMGQMKGGLAVSAVVFIFGYLAASGGLIEHIVFFKEYPARFAINTLIEIALQSLLMGQIILWYNLKYNKSKEK